MPKLIARKAESGVEEARHEARRARREAYSAQRRAARDEVARLAPLTPEQQKNVYATWNRSASVSGYSGVWDVMEDLSTLQCAIFFSPVEDFKTMRLSKTPQLVKAKLGGKEVDRFPHWTVAYNLSARLAFKDCREASKEVKEKGKPNSPPPQDKARTTA